jgi:hypothetical protein
VTESRLLQLGGEGDRIARMTNQIEMPRRSTGCG